MPNHTTKIISPDSINKSIDKTGHTPSLHHVRYDRRAPPLPAPQCLNDAAGAVTRGIWGRWD